jgi:hypothetical protein
MGEHPAKPAKRRLVCFQECLLRGMKIRSMKRRSARHTAHAEDVHFLPVAAKLGVGFEPIHLRFLAERIALRDTNLFRGTERLLFPSHVSSDRRFGNGCLWFFFPNPLIDPMRRVPLLARRTLVRLQNRVDELLHQPQLWLLALWLLTLRRTCIC